MDAKETGDSGGEECVADVNEAFSRCEEGTIMRRHEVEETKKLALSSTSTVYAEHTISNPDKNQVNYWQVLMFDLEVFFHMKFFYSIAAIMQAQIFNDCSDGELTGWPTGRLFELDIQLSLDCGGDFTSIPENILYNETSNDLELRAKLISGEVPAIATIYRYDQSP